MKQIILLTATALILINKSQAQGIKPIDSIRIALLKGQLKNATGATEVNLLNDIAWEHTWSGKDKQPAHDYAAKAKEKATLLNYEKGIGYASLALAWFYQAKNKALTDTLSKTALTIGEKLTDYRLLGRVYHQKWELRKAYEFFVKAGDKQGEADAAAWLCHEYSISGKYDSEGFNYCQRAVELADIKKEITPGWAWYISLFTFETMSDLYKKVGDYDAALNYLNRAAKYATPIDYSLDWGYGRFFMHTGKFDSSVYYFERAYKADPENRFLVKHVGSANLYAKNYERAVTLLEKALAILLSPAYEKRSFPESWRGELHFELAEAYSGLNKNSLAIKNYEIALERHRALYYKLSGQYNKNPNSYATADKLMNISKDLARIFHQLNRNDSAFLFLTKYTQLKDSLQSQNIIWRLNMQLSNYKRTAEEEKRTGHLQLLQKDNLIQAQQLRQQMMLYEQNEIQRSLLQKNSEVKDQQLLLANQELQIKDQGLREQQFLRQQKEAALVLLDKESKLKDQQLKQQTFFRNALIAGLFLLLALAVFIIRYLSVKRKAEKLQNEKVKAELEQQSSELEMQALRAQMNPHFIFNCLSSINRFILKNETETASDYLTRFSRLIRMVLINSQKPMIALEDEIDMLRLYLDMERLRFKDSFDYNINYTNSIESGSVFVPPLLLQPFCENAIWHGLMHKQGQGNLNINLSMKNNMLQCTITDNGIGRKKAEALKTKTGEKSKSLGLKITTDRLALLNQNRNAHTFFEMRDLYDEKGEASGTEVSIKVKYREGITELV